MKNSKIFRFRYKIAKNIEKISQKFFSFFKNKPLPSKGKRFKS